ncbi:putative DNA ligase [Burkholderia phage BcepIL02]|uniref:DNA ligase n=1 Tax=Burkholderia phage BcepIL02 TaxID=2886898 RepID=C5IHN5_9CAUD|nr:putative DNA ligase [Burkholderia phage BcepIL02]ACR15036.1 putative DNA ligase [Burkholderia phage BcepIL02]
MLRSSSVVCDRVVSHCTAPLVQFPDREAPALARPPARDYLPGMLQRSARRTSGFIIPCQPTPAREPPSGPDWLHEIKHDGFRFQAIRDGARVRLLTRNENDWSKRYPAIVDAAAALPARSFVLDGEVVCCDGDGLAVFELLRSRRHDGEAFLYAFDLLELDGEDLRRVELEERKGRLERLLAGAPHGIRFNEHLIGDGPTIFRHACMIGAEGIVSKRRSSRYRSGRCDDWRKSKNPLSVAVRRESEEDWGGERSAMARRRSG